MIVVLMPFQHFSRLISPLSTSFFKASTTIRTEYPVYLQIVRTLTTVSPRPIRSP